MKNSISKRLMVIMLCITVVGMGLIASVSMWMSGSALLNESLGKISEKTTGEAIRINGWLESQTKYVSAFANDMAAMPSYSEDALLPTLLRHYEANEQYFDVYMGFPDGKGVFATGWVPDYAAGWTSYQREWYAGALNNPSAPFITSLYTDSQTGSLCATAAQAVLVNGNVVGVAAADMFIDVLTDIVNQASVGTDSYAFLTDAEGNILIHPNASYGPDGEDNFQNLSTIENGLYKPLWDETSSTGTSYRFVSKDGIARYYTSQEITVTGWRLYTAIPAAIVTAPLTKLLYTVLPIFVVVLLAAAVLIFTTTKRQIVRPIQDVTVAAQKLARGETNIDLSGEYNGELLLLRDSFLNMAQSTRLQVDATSELAAGNLTVTVPVRSAEDVMGNALNQLSSNLRQIMESLQQASTRVSQDADQIASHSQQLAQGATEQAAVVGQLSTSIDEISKKIHSNLDKAAQASAVGERISQNARGGMELMGHMVTSVTGINDASSSISKVIKTIEDIAFQTNILALNAAVEAARAGQYGKGFAVVADEVRNLASKSASAAKETAALIQNSILKASDGVRIAQQTNEALETVIKGIGESVALISEISTAANEEYSAITHITEGISQVSQVVSSTAATSEETAAAAQELSAESNVLRDVAGRFTI